MTQTYDPTHQANHRRQWLPLAVTAGVLVIGAIIAAVFLSTSTKHGSHPATGLFPVTSPLADATKACTAGTLADEDHTLIVDMAGEKPGTGTATIADVLCVLAELEAPQAVLAQMESTRALDGMQSATWSTYEVKWNYHPDHGLDLIITTTN